jgi:hypothetical protein
MLQKLFNYTNRLFERGVLQPELFIGVSETDIKFFQNKFSFEFPESYAQFLRFCGKSGHYELLRWEYNLNFLDSINKEVLYLMEHYVDVGDISEILQSSFCFACDTHGGYSFLA